MPSVGTHHSVAVVGGLVRDCTKKVHIKLRMLSGLGLL